MDPTESNASPQKLIESNQRMTIAHLNNDCLIHLFSYLNLTDLTNVAEANVHLAKSACNVFWYKFRAHEILYCCRRKNYLINNDVSACNAIEFSLMLEHFGKSILKLAINFDLQLPGNYKFIFEALQNNCHTTLMELFLIALPSYGLSKTFSNLRKLKLFSPDIHHSFSEINRWFPELNSLYLIETRSFWEHSSVVQFVPKLQYLGYRRDGSLFTENSLAKLGEFVHLNPQLKSLMLNELYTGELHTLFQEFTPDQFANIEEFEVWTSYSFSTIPIPMGNLKVLKVHFYGDTIVMTKTLPPSVESFELYIPDPRSLTAKVRTLLSNQQLKKLTIISDILCDLNVVEVVNGMPSLMEINIVSKYVGYLDETEKCVTLKQLLMNNNQLKIISLVYEVGRIYKPPVRLFDDQIEIAKKLTNIINDSSNANWQMRHKIEIIKKIHHTPRLFTPHLHLIFEKM